MAKNQDEDVLVEETEDTGAEPRIYELGFHLDPELPVEEVKKAYQAIRETIAGKGTVIAEVEPEKIQLAYTISRQEVAGRRDFSSAYFAWIVYEMTATDHAAVVSAAGANKLIVRFIDLTTTKDAARHALEVHELMAKAPELEPSSEEVLSTELDAALENVAV
ncbi:MAG: 30S ribosomal protein S6 [Candidatus Paceibacterota bacterium]|jgi:ribosomal protein S6